MLNPKNLPLKKILEEAAKTEEDSYNFYYTASKKIDTPHLKKFLISLAEQELIHKNKLNNLAKLNPTEIMQKKEEQITNYLLAEQLKDATISADSSFQDILIVAMKKEKIAYDFYNRLAKEIKDETIIKTLRLIAKEELIHKHQIEIEYDDYVFQEN